MTRPTARAVRRARRLLLRRHHLIAQGRSSGSVSPFWPLPVSRLHCEANVVWLMVGIESSFGSSHIVILYCNCNLFRQACKHWHCLFKKKINKICFAVLSRVNSFLIISIPTFFVLSNRIPTPSIIETTKTQSIPLHVQSTNQDIKYHKQIHN